VVVNPFGVVVVAGRSSSSGPYPWNLDTGCDYAAVGSVAV
jgi:hypothetical protein